MKKDNPEWTDKMFKEAKPAKDVLPKEFFDGITRARGDRGRQKAPTKEQITLRLDPDVLEFFRKKGSGYQAKINAALREYIGLR